MTAKPRSTSELFQFRRTCSKNRLGRSEGAADLRTSGSLTGANARRLLTILSLITTASSEVDISRENLKRHGIIYDEEVYSCDYEDDNESSNLGSSLSDHVEALREALLSFSSIITDDWKELFDNEIEQYAGEILEKQEYLQPSAAAYFTPRRYELRSPSQQSTAARENNEHCKRIAESARKRARKLRPVGHISIRGIFSGISMKTTIRDLKLSEPTHLRNFLGPTC